MIEAPDFEQTAEIAAIQAFHKACGHASMNACGVIWQAVNTRILSADELCLSASHASAIRELLRNTGSLAAIFGTSEPSGKQLIRHHITLEALSQRRPSRQFHQKISKAASDFLVRQISWDEWCNLGFSCDQSTLARRGKKMPALLEANTRAEISAIARVSSNLEIYGCFAGLELAAYIICVIRGRTLEGLLMHWNASAPTPHMTHALYDGFLKLQFHRCDVDDISFGRQWIFPNAGSDFFKRQAGLLESPCHIGILLHPWIAFFVENQAVAYAASALRRLLQPYWAGMRVLELIELAWRTRRSVKCSTRGR